ncbi:competence protein CoiA [Streptococcus oricebi]|uniref:Competence protein CoiA n=1 Tax=Streptococcus oricebi TaxID=1547447 RepID=A0ABS5B1Y6_9STRE|nr:competence protein CoiA family protein [Streptococcus oricebi]MBP2622847.1 competence protein CoiA [Streptococcus oricebi]
MFVARNHQRELIHLLEGDLPDQGPFFCPACAGPLCLRQGPVMQAHFAHLSLKNCQYQSENEGPEHLGLKATLFAWARRSGPVKVEAFLAELGQIADLLVGEKVALEIQCSPLSQARLKERSQSYQEQGYQVIWLLGERLWLKKSLTPLQRDFLYFSQNMGFHLWELDQKEQVLRLKYLLHEDLHGQVQYKELSFPFGQGNLLQVLRLPYQEQNLTSLLAKTDPQISTYVRRQLYYRNPKWLARQAVCYQKGENLLTQKLEDFYPQVTPLKSRTGFCQISQDLTNYYQNFAAYYLDQGYQKVQVLYPPAFYAYIRQGQGEEKSSPSR